MSLYDDVVTDFSGNNKTELKNNNSEIANWNSNNFKLLQIQVEAAKKRQQQLHASAHLKRDKPSTSIAPVIDLSSDRRCKPQLQLKKDDILSSSPNTASHSAPSLNQMPPTAALTNYSSASYHSSNELRFNTITGKIERNETQSIFANSNEEYDPMRPNDYEKLLIELRKGSKQASSASHRKSNESVKRRSRSRSRNRRRKHSHSSSTSNSSSRSRSRSSSSNNRRHSRSSSRTSDDDKSGKKSGRRSSKRHSSSSDDESRKNKRNRNDARNSLGETKRPLTAAFPPPMSLLEETNKSSELQPGIKKPPLKPVLGGLFKAEKMMAKMGYKEGEGLGRNKQGMSIALQVEKTGKRSGRIIHEKDVIEQPVPITPPPPALIQPVQPTSGTAPVVGIPTEVMKNMSKVILLRNMVAPGDVDDDLEGETKEECQKYGEVNRCLIFEIKEKSPEEAVRIFIEFKTLPSAIKALTDLNGRFFGGRKVKATFYNLDKFNRLELADEDSA